MARSTVYDSTLPFRQMQSTGNLKDDLAYNIGVALGGLWAANYNKRGQEKGYETAEGILNRDFGSSDSNGGQLPDNLVQLANNMQDFSSYKNGIAGDGVAGQQATNATAGGNGDAVSYLAKLAEQGSVYDGSGSGYPVGITASKDGKSSVSNEELLRYANAQNGIKGGGNVDNAGTISTNSILSGMGAMPSYSDLRKSYRDNYFFGSNGKYTKSENPDTDKAESVRIGGLVKQDMDAKAAGGRKSMENFNPEIYWRNIESKLNKDGRTPAQIAAIKERVMPELEQRQAEYKDSEWQKAATAYGALDLTTKEGQQAAMPYIARMTKMNPDLTKVAVAGNPTAKDVWNAQLQSERMDKQLAAQQQLQQQRIAAQQQMQAQQIAAARVRAANSANGRSGGTGGSSGNRTAANGGVFDYTNTPAYKAAKEDIKTYNEKMSGGETLSDWQQQDYNRKMNFLQRCEQASAAQYFGGGGAPQGSGTSGNPQASGARIPAIDAIIAKTDWDDWDSVAGYYQLVRDGDDEGEAAKFMKAAKENMGEDSRMYQALNNVYKDRNKSGKQLRLEENERKQNGYVQDTGTAQDGYSLGLEPTSISDFKRNEYASSSPSSTKDNKASSSNYDADDADNFAYAANHADVGDFRLAENSPQSSFGSDNDDYPYYEPPTVVGDFKRNEYTKPDTGVASFRQKDYENRYSHRYADNDDYPFFEPPADISKFKRNEYASTDSSSPKEDKTQGVDEADNYAYAVPNADVGDFRQSDYANTESIAEVANKITQKTDWDDWDSIAQNYQIASQMAYYEGDDILLDTFMDVAENQLGKDNKMYKALQNVRKNRGKTRLQIIQEAEDKKRKGLSNVAKAGQRDAQSIRKLSNLASEILSGNKPLWNVKDWAEEKNNKNK